MNQLKIIHAATTKHLGDVKKLMRAFVTWHRQRHTEDIALINAYFDDDNFEKELQSLPGKYIANEGGCLLLAFYNELPTGCVALKKIDDKVCEMKRMFVYESFHGKGIGHVLARAIVNEAMLMNYATIMLDTSFRQTEAISLYKKMGFKESAPYYILPKELEDWLVFMRFDIQK